MNLLQVYYIVNIEKETKGFWRPMWVFSSALSCLEFITSAIIPTLIQKTSKK